MKVICKIYRSDRQPGVYLFTRLDQGLDAVPVLLKTKLQPLVESMTLVLKPGRQLANADIDKVLSSLSEPGFYLQMPPKDFDRKFFSAVLKDHQPAADDNEH